MTKNIELFWEKSLNIDNGKFLFYIVKNPEKYELGEKLQNEWIYNKLRKQKSFSFKLFFKNLYEYVESFFENEFAVKILVTIILSNTKTILEKGYISWQDYEKTYKKVVDLDIIFENINNIENLSEFILKWLIEENKNKKKQIKQISDINFVKKKILDFSSSKDKIYIFPDFIISFFSNLILNSKWEYENVFLFNEILELVESNEEELFLIKLLDNMKYLLRWDLNKTYKLIWSYFWMHLPVWDIFYSIFYKKYINPIKLSETQIKNNLKTLINSGMLKIITYQIYEIDNIKLDVFPIFVNLFFANVFDFYFLNTKDFSHERVILNSEYLDYVIQKQNIKEYENVQTDEIIDKDLKTVSLEEKILNTAKIFYDKQNINKKNLKYKKTDFSNIWKKVLPKWKNLKESLNQFFKDLFTTENEDILFLAQVAYKISKRYTISDEILPLTEDLVDFFVNFIEKYKWKIISVDELVNVVLKINTNFYFLFSDIAKLFNFSEKIEDYDKYFSPNEMFKNLLIILSKKWYFKLYVDKKEENVYYYTSSWYWYSYYYDSKRAKIEYCTPKYIEFKDIDFKAKLADKSYFSSDTIYLSLNTDKQIIEKLSKFTILDNIWEFLVLKITRDSLIKWKNTFDVTKEEIFNIFDKLKLETPKNVKLMIESIYNKKEDLILIPSWISVVVSNKWIFNEITKLKMFSILYKKID